MKKSLEKLVSQVIATGKFETFTDPSSPPARIARAALELFAEHSYEGTTTKAIADRARTTERTLFKHFESKDQLFARTVFPAFLQAWTSTIAEPAANLLEARRGDFRKTLRALLVNRIAIAVEHPAIVIMMWRELLIRPAFRSAHRKVLARRGKPIVETFIARGKSSGQIRELPTEAILRAITAQLVGYLVMRLVLAPEQAWDTEADADQILALIMRGIGRDRRRR
ncbi:MAG TPA: helix-turn-helix domain-containing protein [Polyangiaceae bacterium]|nr:helix-turn-helix domain-containing protein [Polyangiaceae bacterium]